MNDDERKQEIKNIAMGRPRKWDRPELARKMLEWACEPTSTNLNGFCADLLIAPSKITEFAREDDNFRLAYESTKAILAKRREQKLSSGELHIKAYDLNATVYDRFLKEERQDQMRFEASLKTEVVADPNSQSAMERLMQYISAAQSSDRERKSSSTDSRS